MKIKVEKLIILICIIFFGYGLISMILYAISDTGQSLVFFIFGSVNWSIGMVLLIGLYYGLMKYLTKLKKGEIEIDD